jgi:N-acetylmuramoyl-L-alanine amidase
MYFKVEKCFASVFIAVLILLFTFTNNVHAEGVAAKTIVLDPGHGGYDPGAVSNGYMEKDLNNSLTQKVADKLKALGFNVLFTRNPASDDFVSLEDRTKYANSVNADLFISIHHDSSAASSTNGTSTHYSSYRPGIDQEGVYVVYNSKYYRFIREGDRGFYIDYNGTEKFVSIDNASAFDSTPSKAAVDSANLASKLVDAIGSLGVANRGSRDHNLFVTRNTNMPSVLIEAGFISNPTEANILASDAFQNELAQKIVNVISEFLGQAKNETIDEKYRLAYEATIKAQATKDQKDLTAARLLVTDLHQMLPKELKSLAETLSAILDKVQHPLLVKTVDAITKAQITGIQADINASRDLIIYMPEVWRNSYSMAIDKVQDIMIKRVVDSIVKAEESGLQEDIDSATVLYNELLTVTNNDGVKDWAQNQLKLEMDKLD